MSNFAGVRKSNFRPLDPVNAEVGSDTNGHLYQMHKDAGEAELGLSGQVEHRNGDGGVRELSQWLVRIYRRIVAPTSGRVLTVAEREAIRDQIVQAFTEERGSPFGPDDRSEATPALIAIASLLAGLTDELAAPEKSASGGDVRKATGAFETVEAECPYCHKANTVENVSADGAMQKIRCAHCSETWSENLREARVLAKSGSSSEVRDFIAQTRAQIESLTKQITDLLNRRAAASPAKFRANPQDAFRRNIEKALANPVPVAAQGHGLDEGTSKFKTVQSVASGVRVREGEVLKSEETGPAAAELRKALENGKPAFTF